MKSCVWCEVEIQIGDNSLFPSYNLCFPWLLCRCSWISNLSGQEQNIMQNIRQETNHDKMTKEAIFFYFRVAKRSDKIQIHTTQCSIWMPKAHTVSKSLLVTAWGFMCLTRLCETTQPVSRLTTAFEGFPIVIMLFFTSVPANGLMVQIWVRKKKKRAKKCLSFFVHNLPFCPDTLHTLMA